MESISNNITWDPENKGLHLFFLNCYRNFHLISVHINFTNITNIHDFPDRTTVIASGFPIPVTTYTTTEIIHCATDGGKVIGMATLYNDSTLRCWITTPRENTWGYTIDLVYMESF